MSKAQEHINKLGFRVKEKITQQEGVITSVCFDINGCIQAWVQPPKKKDDSVPDGKWYDVARLEIISKTPVFQSPNYIAGPIAEGRSGAEHKGAPH